ncbi:hypothetical protein JOQ06_003791 [Pogonophryne albipinna]|uniref:Uncharacterized protein n=1 Tax=Pogonophryne albipinna TaxID=1090488 RepID=A0AAD6AHL5_9TELE|nr:hypothetical protein JOQ06_003791 [Pogonophryne albipinna]
MLDRDADLTTFQRKKSSRSLESKASIHTFFLRDDVSCMTTGRKQTITVRKKKMQKRLLSDTLKNLQRKFASENSDNVSYCLFCACRPFWVVAPTDADRATCQCKTHENLQFMADTLYSHGIVVSKNIEEMVDRTVCATEIKACAYGECVECRLTTHPTLKSATEEIVQVVQWSTERTGEEERKTITLKKEVQSTESELMFQMPSLFSKNSRDWNRTVELFFVSEEEVEAKTEVPALTPIKGTMRMHQVISVLPGHIKYRDISCFCQRQDGPLDCACFDLKVANVNGVPVTPPKQNEETPWRPAAVDSTHIGGWCVIKYDDDVYPGIIMDVEEDSIQVKCMHRNGVNKYFWPRPREDVSWYAEEQLLCLIPEPKALNKRSVQLEKLTWK